MNMIYRALFSATSPCRINQVKGYKGKWSDQLKVLINQARIMDRKKLLELWAISLLNQ